MTKSQVKAALGIQTDADLARQFTPPIGRWAVGQWPENEPVPAARQWELRARHPGKFGPAPADKAA
ncbi:MAG: hypothetical protein M3R16_08105 [Pseudomonadota bacterium]|nr:hypothetical protein [Pseudomonadota bacterium]